MRAHLHNENSGSQINKLGEALAKQDLETSLLEAQTLLQQIRTLNLRKLLTFYTLNDILNKLRNRNVYLLLKTGDSHKPTLFDKLAG